ncbi:T9SS type A sorting domain-containing protein [Winogradskyella costae]|uniref:T9SS type A sorting domain-containing protein n=1 Tax=Winogradskyella costae TaxID=2697008 RepID=UPI0015C8F4A2|nr:T9SS type A sorting domain-containing protein [Winogradskyella costae]
MKKITLLALALAAFQFNYAQDTCATAAVVTAGTHTVAAVDGTDIPDPICADNGAGATAGEWYSFTATIDGIATVTTDLPANAGGDTRLHVYSGACGSLTCVGGNDDVAANFLSEAEWLVATGTTYYIAFDDRWSNAGFDFEITETAVTCDYSAPYAETFDDNNQFLVCYTIEDVDGDTLSWITQQDLDLDGDLIPETFATNASGTEDSTNKDDWFFSPALELTAGTEYQYSSSYNVLQGTANASLEAFIVDGPSSTANVVATLFTNAGFTTQGEFETLETMAYQESSTFTPSATDDYYIAYRSFGPRGGGFLLLFDSSLDTTLSVGEVAQNDFNHFYNKDLKVLNLESSNMAMTNIEIYSLLGQSVISRSLSNTSESISVSSLTDGVYIAKVTINGNSKTIKFVKS